MQETRIDLVFDGKVYSGSYSVKFGIMTVNLGSDSKKAQVGHATLRVLARLLIYQLVKERAGRDVSPLSR